MPLSPAQEAALKKFLAERQAYDNTEGMMLRSGSIAQDLAGREGVSSIDDAMRRNAEGGPLRPSSPQELSILNQAKQGLDQGNFVRAARGGLLDAPPEPPQAQDAPYRRTMDYRYEANNIPPKMGGGIGNLLSNIFGGGSAQPTQAAPQAPQPQAPQAPPQQGGQNWAQLLLEGFGAGAQGMSVPQLHMAQAQAKLQQFEVQDKMRTQAAQQNFPQFQQKMKAFKPFWKQYVDQKKLENPNFAPSTQTFVEATEAWDEQFPEMAISQTDQDTFNRTAQGTQTLLGMGLLPLNDMLEVKKLGLQEDAKQAAAFRASLMQMPGNQQDVDYQRKVYEQAMGGGQPQIGQVSGGTGAPGDELSMARTEAESRYPFLKKFRDVGIAPSKVKNKGGMGEFVGPDDPTNPNPGQYTITIGENSANLQGGVADTIVADMVHAAADMDPQFQGLKKELRNSLSDEEIQLARRRYEKDFKGKYTGSNFESFENFLTQFWLDGTVQHLLLPENSEIEEFKRHNPKAVQVLGKIERLFKAEPKVPGSQEQGPVLGQTSPQAPFTPFQQMAQQRGLDLQAAAAGAGLKAQAELPAELMKLKATESTKANLAEQQASLKEQQITKRGEETLKQIQAKSKEALQLQSVKTADATTLKKVDHELRLTRDAARDQEAMARVRERLSTIPAGSLTFEQRAAMKVFEATEAGGRVDANNAAKSARQLAAMANTSERDVFRLLLESGAVGAGDLMRATKMADTKLKADPDSSGSLSREVLGAIHDIRAERAVDPVTEDINFALSASDNPAAIRQLNILRNVYRSHQAKAETPAQRKTWDEALAQVDENLNGVKKEAIDKKQVFRAPYTMADGSPGEALLTPDPDSATGFSVVQIPTAGGTQPAMAAKKSLVEQQFGSAGERKALVETKNTIEQAEMLLKDFDKFGKDIVGPIDQFMARVGKVTGTVPEDRLQYEATLNAMATDFRHQLFGSALTAQEVKSALKSIPDMEDQDDVHKSKLKAMLKNMKRLQGLQEESMGKRKSAVGKKSDEDRLTELLDQGATRDEAIRIMVEEGR